MSRDSAGRLLTELRRSNAAGIHSPSRVRSRENVSAILDSMDGAWDTEHTETETSQEANMADTKDNVFAGDIDAEEYIPEEYEPTPEDLEEAAALFDEIDSDTFYLGYTEEEYYPEDDD